MRAPRAGSAGRKGGAAQRLLPPGKERGRFSPSMLQPRLPPPPARPASGTVAGAHRPRLPLPPAAGTATSGPPLGGRRAAPGGGQRSRPGPSPGPGDSPASQLAAGAQRWLLDGRHRGSSGREGGGPGVAEGKACVSGWGG